MESETSINSNPIKDQGTDEISVNKDQNTENNSDTEQSDVMDVIGNGQLVKKVFDFYCYLF